MLWVGMGPGVCVCVCVCVCTRGFPLTSSPPCLRSSVPTALPLTWGAGGDVVRLLLLLGPPVAALLGISALALQTLTTTGAHATLLKLLVVFYLQGQKALGEGPTANQPKLPFSVATQDPGTGETPAGLQAKRARFSAGVYCYVPSNKHLTSPSLVSSLQSEHQDLPSGVAGGCEEMTDAKGPWSAKVLVPQLCLILCNPMDCSLPGSSVHGIFPARILEWVAFPSEGNECK